MAQGQDKIASSLLELQPTAIIELFLLYFNTVDAPNAYIAFHGGSVYNKGIVWQGTEYLPIPVETDGFEVNGNGQLARPKIRISNKDYFATDLLINYDDLQFAKFIRKRTFVKFLDDVNFDGGNPWGQADASAEISSDVFVVGQKTAENKTFVELELTSPLDLDNFEINSRLIMSRYCSWQYRGNGCNYKGIPVATEENALLTVRNEDKDNWSNNVTARKWATNQSYVVNQAVYLENTKVTVADQFDSSKIEFAKIWYVCKQAHTSSQYNAPDKNSSFWSRDGCNKKIDGCKLRFGKNASIQETIQEIRTINKIDMSRRTGLYRTNCISAIATCSGFRADDQGQPNQGHSKLNDLIVGAGSIFRSKFYELQGAGSDALWMNFGRGVDIGRIDIYDDPATTQFYQNLESCQFNLFSVGAVTARSPAVAINNIPTNGTRATHILTSPTTPNPFDVGRIYFTGTSPTYGYFTASEIVVFERTPSYFFFDEGNSAFANEVFQMSSWIELAESLPVDTNELFSVFHNVRGNCRYSGVNVFFSGNDLYLSFATRTVGGTSFTSRDVTIPNWGTGLRPFNLVCVGGVPNTNTTTPTAATPGYVRITDGNTLTGTYTLANNEYFKFKSTNSTFSGGMRATGVGSENLQFAINTWQCPTGSEFVPNPRPNGGRVVEGVQYMTPIRFSPIAMWAGNDSSAVDTRINDNKLTMYRIYSDFIKVNANTSNLLAYWDNDINGNEVQSLNLPIKKLFIVKNKDNSPSGISDMSTVDVTRTVNIPFDLPFGGFPGTENYG